MKKESLVQESVKILMAKRDKLRAKIIATSKNKESRSNYNSLLRYTKDYEEITSELQRYGKKVSISSDLLKREYWQERYRQFNSDNPNVIMPAAAIEYGIMHNNRILYQFEANELEYNMVSEILTAIKSAVKGKLTIKKL